MARKFAAAWEDIWHTYLKTQRPSLKTVEEAGLFYKFTGPQM